VRLLFVFVQFTVQIETFIGGVYSSQCRVILLLVFVQCTV